MSHSKIPLRKWATAVRLHLTTKGVSGMELHRLLDLNYRSAWFMLHRIREGWPEQDSLNCEVAEIDETLFGGKEKNKHSKNKLRTSFAKTG